MIGKQIEKTLKIIGKTILIVGTLASLAVGIVFLAQGYSFYVPLGLCILIGGSVASVISGCQIYGLGELIETSKKIEDNTAYAHKES